MAAHNPLAAVAHGHSLAEAIVDTVREPLVVLDRDLRVIVINALKHAFTSDENGEILVSYAAPEFGLASIGIRQRLGPCRGQR